MRIALSFGFVAVLSASAGAQLGAGAGSRPVMDRLLDDSVFELTEPRLLPLPARGRPDRLAIPTVAPIDSSGLVEANPYLEEGVAPARTLVAASVGSELIAANPYRSGDPGVIAVPAPAVRAPVGDVAGNPYFFESADETRITAAVTQPIEIDPNPYRH